MKIKYCAILFSIAFILTLFSCAGGPTIGASGEPKPDWVSHPPLDDEYYIGIGTGTNTDEAAARDNAIYRAKSYLAGDILTQISSQTNIHDFESSKGEVYESYESNIMATMEANLQGTEIVGEWESPDGVYWVYLRLEIATWLEIQEKEMRALEKRVRDLVEPLVNAPNKTIVEKLTVLWKGWELVYNSPYAGLVDTTMFGEDGDLFDTIERKIVSYVNSLSLDVPISNISIEYGRPLKVEASVDTYFDDKIGKIPIGFYLNEDDDRPAITFNTDSSGNFDGEFALPGLELGKTAVFARINLAEFGIDESRMVTQLIYPESSFLVDYQQIKVGLAVDITDPAVRNADASAKDLFSERNLPFKVDVSGGAQTYVIRFQIKFEDIKPLYENQPLISYCTTVVSIEKNGHSLFAFESDKNRGKAGGLTYEQAHNAGLEKSFEWLAKQDEFYEGMISVLDLD